MMFPFSKFKKECTVSTTVKNYRVIYIIDHPALDAQNMYSWGTDLDKAYGNAYRIVKNLRKANSV